MGEERQREKAESARFERETETHRQTESDFSNEIYQKNSLFAQ